MAVAQSIANVILHVVLLATFIAGFFFLYASVIEQKVVTSQVDNLISDMTSDLKAVLSPVDKQVIMEAFKTMKPPDMTEEDKEAADKNKKLLVKASTVVGTIFITGIVIVALLSWMFKFSFLDMLKENIVVLLVAAAVEFSFLSFFARRYQSLDPNMVKLTVIKAMQAYASQ